MWAAGIVGGVIAIAILVALVGAWFVSIPLVLLAVAGVSLVALNRRRRDVKRLQEHREQAASNKVEFTERDRQTLTSE
jgi:biopolymer transport protein ExbB/TolQ